MSTPYAITPLVRWRIRDWVSCFYACRFPLDEEPDIFCSSSPRLPHKNTVYKPKGDNGRRSHETNKKVSVDNRYHKEKESVQNLIDAEQGVDESSWPSFTEEDYIVFCFRDDGAIHVVRDRKSEASDHIDHDNRSSSRPVSRKLTYGENAERVHNSSQEDMLSEDLEKYIYPTNEEDSIISDKKGKDKGGICINTELAPDDIKEVNVVEENTESKVVSAESSESNQSDASTSSFAFPVMGWEWTGSPVQMPKSEGLHLRKHKPRSVRFHCCRF